MSTCCNRAKKQQQQQTNDDENGSYEIKYHYHFSNQYCLGKCSIFVHFILCRQSLRRVSVVADKLDNLKNSIGTWLNELTKRRRKQR